MDYDTPQSRGKITIRRPRSSVPQLRLSELWDCRELIYTLFKREVSARYKQTYLGIAWAIIVPVMTMVVFSLIFGSLAKIPSNGFPYPVFLFCGLLPWQLFSKTVVDISNSIVTNGPLVKKVYFHRLVLPLSLAGVGVVDFAAAFTVLVALLVYFGIAFQITILIVPVILVYAIVAALAVGLPLAAMNVQYRDVKYLTPVITQFWFFATPLVYPSNLVPAPWNSLLALNPMTGVVDLTRWAILGDMPPSLTMLGISIGTSVFLFVGGVYYFQSQAPSFADRA